MTSEVIDLEGYQPLPIAYELRYSILQKIKKGLDPLPDIQGREEVKKDVLRALLSGAHTYLVSEEGTGKTRLARSLTKLLSPIPIIKGCLYNDSPKWPSHLLCPRCRASQDPVAEFGIEIVSGERRFSRIQGNEYTNEVKLLGLKDIQVIVQGKSPSDPEAFTGTGVFRANRGILFIDELPAIRNKVQVLLHPIFEEKKAILEEYNWEHPLDLVVIATGNPQSFSHVNEVPRPLLDRLELVYMDLPSEEIEREIVLGEKFQVNNEYGRHTHETGILTYPSAKDLERKVITPWWIVHLVTGAARHSRTCSWLDKKASIRGSIRALDHTCASTELEKRQVANLTDAYLGLRLALRGRIGLRADLVDLDRPKVSFAKTDRIVEDLLYNAIEDLDFQFDVDSEAFGKEVVAFYYDGLADITGRLGKYPELNRVVEQLKTADRDKPSDVTKKGPDISKLDKDVIEEYNRSALETVINLACHRRLIDADVTRQTFIPRIIMQGDI